MKRHIFLTYPLTRTYVPSYRHLDRTKDVCFARMTKPHTVAESESGDDWVQRCLVVLNPEDLVEARAAHREVAKVLKDPVVTFRRFMQHAIEDYFAQGCACSHDCCACTTGYGRAKQIGPRTFAVSLHMGINV